MRAALGSQLLYLDSAVSALLTANKRDTSEMILRLGRLSPQRKVQDDRQRLDELLERAIRGLSAQQRLRRAQVDGLSFRLQALSPLAVLQRGYAVLRGPDGRILQSISQVHPGDSIAARIQDGELTAQVQKITPSP
jgi:exodeoxyribonuclease VII large subunit